MDATMVAMRSASEQQLSNDCLSGVDGNQGAKSPSVESLMTLLWAIKVISGEQKETSGDVTTGIRQVCGELNEMFGRGEKETPSLSFGLTGQKSWEGRTAHS